MAKSNLIPNSERSPEELREMGRKGGIKSGESRRRNKLTTGVCDASGRGILGVGRGKETD